MGYNQEYIQLIQEYVTSQLDAAGGSIADQQRKCSHQYILSHHTISTMDQKDQSSKLKEPALRASKKLKIWE